jgi:hypothetical protein
MGEHRQFVSCLGEVATHFGMPLSVILWWRDNGNCPHLKREPYDLKAITTWAEQRADALNLNAQTDATWWCVDNRFKALAIIALPICAIIIGLLTLSSKYTPEQEIVDAGVVKVAGPYDDLIGKTLPEARHILGLKKKFLRVVIEDGKGGAVTADIRGNRLNVEIRDGRVVRVLGPG